MAAGNQWKDLEFTLALSRRFFSFTKALLSTYWLLRTPKHKGNRPVTRNNADVPHCEKDSVFYLQNKAIYRAEDRPADICLKMIFT